MQFMLLLIALSGYVALAESSLTEILVHPGGIGGLYKGPNSETIIKGPDGSVITAQEEGGAVVTQDLSQQPIVVPDIVEVEPLQSVEPVISTVSVAPAVTAAPILAASPVAAVAPVAGVAPIVPVGRTVEIIQPDPHIIETEIVDAPAVEPQQSSDLVGPSGSISVRGSSSIVSGPASTTISEPARVVVATPLVAAIPVISSVTTPLRAIPVAEPAIPLGPTISTVTVGPPIATVTDSQLLISSLAPPTDLSSVIVSVPPSISTLVPPTRIISTTLAPPVLVSTPTSNIGASIQPASSYGVINNIENTVSFTPRPNIILSSTLAPGVGGIGSTTPSTNLDLINNRQLNINPSLIPSANIIPPEIGPLPPGAIDLGSTVTVSTTPRAPTLVPPIESPNIQRISSGDSILLENNIRSSQQSPNIQIISNGDSILLDNNIRSVQESSIRADGRIDQLGTNQGFLTSNAVQPFQVSGPLLRDTHPIPVGISRNGLVGSQLARSGIDSSRIDLANVPLSSVSGLPQTIDQEIDDVSAELWNRYGRDVKEKKTKGQKGNNKEK